MNCALCGADDAEQEEGLCPACDRLSSVFTRTLDSKDPTQFSATGPVTEPPPPGARFAPGQVFAGRYTIVEQVGAGGMGQVYKAIDRQLNRTVALKLIRPGLQARLGALQRFRRELVLAQQVTHPNVCRVHDLGEVEGILYISMEFVTGQTLDDLIRAMGHLSPRQTIALGRQVCAGLQAIHDQSIVHRDLKPGNIMVDRSGHAVVMDFGMALHHGDDRLTSEGSVLGTLAYLSPEHARGQTTDVRSDIYALGVIFYEMLSGRRPPGDGVPLPLALREANERCPPPSHFIPEVPAALDAVVLRCLQRDPAIRYASAAELEQGFSHAAAALSTTLMPAAATTAFTRPIPLTRARRGTVIAGLLVVAALVGVVAIIVKPPPPVVVKPRLVVALLPLVYQGEPESSWLKDLVPKGVGDSLRAYSGVEVVPFGSSHAYDPAEDPKTVAAQLGVDAVVRGSIRVRDQKVETELRGWRGDGLEVRPLRVESDLEKVFGQNATLAAQLVESLGIRGPRPPVPPRDPQALASYLKGQSFLEGWDVDANDVKAEEAFTKAIKIDASFAEAHAGLAAALWRRYLQTSEAPLVERALDAAQRAVSLAPSLPEAQLALGITLLGRGRTPEAAAAFAEARKRAPGDDAACRQMARAYFALKRNDEAEKLYQQAIDLRPLYWENYNAKASFYLRTGRHQEAKDLYAKVIELRPLSIAAFNNKAAVHMMDGEFKAAEPLLRAALQLGPSFEVRTNLGFVLYAQGRYEEAAEEYRTAVEGGVARAETYGSLGDAYRQAGRPADARVAYEKAIVQAESRLKVNPADTVLRSALGWFLAGAQQCVSATRETTRALGGGEVEGTTHYYAAVAYALCGDRAKAVRETLRALDRDVVADVRTNPDLRTVRTDPQVERRLRATPTP